MSRLLALSLFASLALGHGDHSFDLDDAADNGMGYAERHVSRTLLHLVSSSGKLMVDAY